MMLQQNSQKIPSAVIAQAQVNVFVCLQSVTELKALSLKANVQGSKRFFNAFQKKNKERQASLNVEEQRKQTRERQQDKKRKRQEADQEKEFIKAFQKETNLTVQEIKQLLYSDVMPPARTTGDATPPARTTSGATPTTDTSSSDDESTATETSSSDYERQQDKKRKRQEADQADYNREVIKAYQKKANQTEQEIKKLLDSDVMPPTEQEIKKTREAATYASLQNAWDGLD